MSALCCSSSEELRLARRLLNGVGSEAEDGSLEKVVDAAVKCSVGEQREVARKVMEVAMSRMGRRVGVWERLVRVTITKTAKGRAKMAILVGWRKGVPIEVMEVVAEFCETFGSILLYEIASLAQHPTPSGFLSCSLLSRSVTATTLHPAILHNTLHSLTTPATLPKKFNHLSHILDHSIEFLAESGYPLGPLYTALTTSLVGMTDSLAAERVEGIIKKIEPFL